MKRLFGVSSILLVFLAVMTIPCQAQEKPKEVIVVNAANNPVPVTVGSAEPNGVMVTLVENAVPISETYIIDVRQFRYLSFLGSCPSTGIFTAYFLDIGFLDTFTPNGDYQSRTPYLAPVSSMNCSPNTSAGMQGNWPLALAGPFLEVRIRNNQGGTSPLGIMTLKAYLQK